MKWINTIVLFFSFFFLQSCRPLKVEQSLENWLFSTGLAPCDSHCGDNVHVL